MGIIDGMLGGGAPGIKFEKVGDSVEGVIVEINERQGLDYDTDLPLWWAGGGKTTTTVAPGQQPYMVPIFSIQIEPQGPEDDGIRSLWLRSNLYTAVIGAIKAAFPGQRKIDDSRVIGGVLKVQHHDLGEKKGKGKQPKLFRAKLEPRQIVDTGDSEDPGAGAESW